MRRVAKAGRVITRAPGSEEYAEWGRTTRVEESAEQAGERRWPGGCETAKEGVDQPEGCRAVRRVQSRKQGAELTGGRQGIRNAGENGAAWPSGLLGQTHISDSWQS